MLNLIDVDIFNVSRPWSDYAYDVFADGIWIASAKCYAAADDVANQAWYDSVLATEPPPGFPDDDDGSPDGGGPPRAPSLYELLVAECQAELDARRPVVMVMDTEFAPLGWPA
jgi:hypothetical protein